MTSPEPVHPKVFISYAHNDNESPDLGKRWLDRLLEHLGPLVHQGYVDVWSDERLEIGEDWHQTIQSSLQTARAAVLLVSPAFLASTYIRNSELPVLLKNARDQGVVILSIILRPCMFVETKFKYPDPVNGPEELSLSTFQSANPPSKPLNGLSEEEQDEILLSVAQRLLRLAQQSPSGKQAWKGADQQARRQTAPPQNNLPRPSTSFIGREEDITAWCDLLRQPTTRLVTLTGSGGVGKTRAALEVARRCLEEFSDDFPHGVWWVELAEERSSDDMISHITHCLPLQLQPQPSVREQLWNFLRERHMLLVLDNVEQIPDAAEVIHELLDAVPHVKCVVTSRRALDLQAENLVEVLPLPSSDAETLFVERARARQADFALTADNAADVTALCRRLEGVPLAIELAASRVRGMSPRDMLNRLDDVLKSRASDLPPRQRALRAAIDWSYDLLTDDDKSLFAQLAVFAGGFTLEDAEVIGDAPNVFGGVEEIVAHSLLRAETAAVTQDRTFSMLASVRAYAAEKLAAFGDAGQSVRQRHAEYFLHIARECIIQLRTRSEVSALQQFEIHFDNVRAAMDWTFKEGRHEQCARFALVLGTFLQRRGFQMGAFRHIQMGLNAVRQLQEEHTALYAHLLRERAGLHLDLLEWDEAHQWATQALALFERLNDPQGQAEANNLLGQAGEGQKNFTEARNYYRLALEQFEQAGEETGIATARNNLGCVEYKDKDGSREEAACHWQEALRLRREQGDRRGIAEVSTNLGALAQEQGRLDEAWRYYHEALQFEQELHHVFGVGRALSNLGEVAELKGELKRAGRLFAAAVHLFDDVGSPYRDYTAEMLHRVAASLNADAEIDALRETLKGRSLDDPTLWALGDDE